MAREAGSSLPPVLLLYDLDPSWDEEDERLAERTSRRLGHAMRMRGHSVRFVPVRSPDVLAALGDQDPEGVIVFNWCESIPGTTHTEVAVVEALESRHFTFTGATASALALCYDKPRVKDLLREHGIPVARGRVFEKPEVEDWSIFPAIVKPSSEHCSYGVTPEAVVMTPQETARRVAYVLKTFDQPALVEEFIDGRELHVSLWGNGDCVEMLPPAEMDFSAFSDVHDRICSYDAKFTEDSRAYRQIRTLLPAPLTDEELSNLRRVAIDAYRLVGCRDYGRIDIRMRDGLFYVLDVNPNADISHDASLAMAAKHAGYVYGEFGSRVVSWAAARRAQNLAPHQ